MTTTREIADRLRERILAGVYAGRLDPGDRLPSIRELSDQLEADHRTVANAYRELAGQGLVEIRPRSGVYVAPIDRIGREPDILSESADWIADVGRDAWLRRIPFEKLPGLIERCLASRRWRCVCVEATTDGLESMDEELERLFHLDVAPVEIEGDYERLEPECESEIREAFGEGDLAVTSVFHAEAIERLAEEAGIPLVVSRLDPDLIASLRRLATDTEEGVAILAVDRDAGERYRKILELPPERLPVVTVDEIEAFEMELRRTPVLVTPAARNRVGDLELPRAIDPAALISKETANTLARTIVWLSLGEEPPG